MGSQFTQRSVEFSTRLTAALYRGSLALLSAAVSSGAVLCQEPGASVGPDSLLLPQQSNVRFERNVNTYLWNGSIGLAKNLGSTRLHISERYESRLIRATEDFVKDEQVLDLELEHSLNEHVSLALDATSFLLSDNGSVGINEVSNHALLGGLRYSVKPGFRVSPMVGVRFDNQSSERDRGISYSLAAETDRFDVGGYGMEFSGRFSQDQVHPRRSESDTLALSVHKVFFEETRNGLQARFTRQRRDFYFPIDPLLGLSLDLESNIESRTENIVEVVDSLHYAVNADLSVGLRGQVFNRVVGKNIRYKDLSSPTNSLLDTEIEEFRLEGEIQLTYRMGNRLFTALRLSVGERDERHALKPVRGVDQSILADFSRQELRKDNTARRTTLAGSLAWAVSRSDTVLLSGSSGLLRYDTPSELNVDDRDELMLVFNATTIHALSPYIRLRLSAAVNLNHVVYVFAARSANNNWNRVWRLSPRIEYSPSDRLSTMNGFEVLANYTVYDFEEQVFSVRSFSFRQFAFLDSTLYRLSDRLGMFFSAYVKLYERGELTWKEFKERPVNYFEEKTFEFQVRYSAGVRVYVAAGVRSFSQLRFVYRGRDRERDHTVKSYGPTSTIAWTVGRRTQLTVNGWYELQEQTGVPDRSIANMSMNLSVRL